MAEFKFFTGSLLAAYRMSGRQCGEASTLVEELCRHSGEKMVAWHVVKLVEMERSRKNQKVF